MAQGDAAQRVLDEVGDADDTEPDRRKVEERIDGPGAHSLVGQDHDVGPVLLDDLRQLVERAELGDVLGAWVLPHADESEHRERSLVSSLQLGHDLGRATAGADDEHAPLRDAPDSVLPSRGEREDGHGRLGQLDRAEVDTGHPEVEGRHRHEPRRRSRRRSDGRSEREVRAQRGA